MIKYVARNVYLIKCMLLNKMHYHFFLPASKIGSRRFSFFFIKSLLSLQGSALMPITCPCYGNMRRSQDCSFFVMLLFPCDFYRGQTPYAGQKEFAGFQSRVCSVPSVRKAPQSGISPFQFPSQPVCLHTSLLPSAERLWLVHLLHVRIEIVCTSQ